MQMKLNACWWWRGADIFNGIGDDGWGDGVGDDDDDDDDEA